MAFLVGNTGMEFFDLSLEDGAKTTRLVLRQGTASFYVNPSGVDYFSVTGGDFTVEADGRAGFRLDNFDDGSVVNVTKGRVSVLRKSQTTALVKGQSLSMRAGDNESVKIERLPDSDDFDRWVSGREDTVVTATNAAQQYVNSPYYTSGFGDLYTYGSWYPIGGYGNCWLPYHYGGWIFDPVFGWLWSPGFGFGGFSGFVPFRPVTGVFVRSKTGLLGLVPVHPLDARGKEPINLAKGIFPVTAGAVSSRVAVNTRESWKAMKAPPRDALTVSAVSASAAPTRVSRTVLAGNAGTRVVTLDRGSSIAFDAREHKFVNASNAPAASAKSSERAGTELTGVAGGEAAARVGGSAAQNAAGARGPRAPPAAPAPTPPPPAPPPSPPPPPP